jgi:hypothetical protein
MEDEALTRGKSWREVYSFAVIQCLHELVCHHRLMMKGTQNETETRLEHSEVLCET